MSPNNVPDLITSLVEAIYSEPRAGRPMPARIELGPELFPVFQAAHRESMAALLPEVESVYPGSLCGVPVSEMDEVGAILVRLDGRRRTLMLNSLTPKILPRRLDTVVLRVMQAEDLPTFNAIYTDPEVRQFAEKPAAPPVTKFALLGQRPELQNVLIESLVTGEVIGWCGLEGVPGAPEPTCEPEIFLARGWQRKGIGGQVLAALIDIASDLGFELQAKVHSGNKASHVLLSNLGWSATESSGEWVIWRSGIASV